MTVFTTATSSPYISARAASLAWLLLASAGVVTGADVDEEHCSSASASMEGTSLLQKPAAKLGKAVVEDGGNPTLVPLRRESVPIYRRGKVASFKTSYSGILHVGNPPQEFRVVFDTGSAHVVLPAAECKSESCLVHRRFNMTKSTTSLPINTDGGVVPEGELCDQVTIGFGTGQITGEFVKDTVCFDLPGAYVDKANADAEAKTAAAAAARAAADAAAAAEARATNEAQALDALDSALESMPPPAAAPEPPEATIGDPIVLSQTGAELDAAAGRSREAVFVQAPSGTNGCADSTVELTQAECEAAAAHLGISKRSDFVISTPHDPKGCFHVWGEMYFNTHPNGSAHNDRTPCCRQAKFVVGTSGQNECPVGSVGLTEGECEAAAAHFGISKHANFVISEPHDPKGCFHVWGEMYYNSHPSGGRNAERVPYCREASGSEAAAQPPVVLSAAEQRAVAARAEVQHPESTLCVDMHVVLAVEMSTQPFKSFLFDGILGLSLDGLALNSKFSAFDMLTTQNKLQRPHFGVFLTEGEDGEDNEIAFGGHNVDRTLEPLSWAPIVMADMGYWQVRILSVRVDGKELDVCKDGTCRGVVDTGTSHLGIPAPFDAEIADLLTVDSGDLKDCRLADAPAIEIEVEGYNLSLHSFNYMRRLPLREGVTVGSKQGVYVPSNETNATLEHRSAADAVPLSNQSANATTNASANATAAPSAASSSNVTANASVEEEEVKRYCRPRLMPVRLPEPLGPKLFILGEPVLHRYYTVFDWKQKQVAFALANNRRNTMTSDELMKLRSAGGHLPKEVDMLLMQTSTERGRRVTRL